MLAEQLGNVEHSWGLRMYMIGAKPLPERQETIHGCHRRCVSCVNLTIIAWASQTLGFVKLDLGDFDAAETFFWKGMQAWKRLHNRWLQSSNLSWISWIYQYRGLYPTSCRASRGRSRLESQPEDQTCKFRDCGKKQSRILIAPHLVQAKENLHELKPLAIDYQGLNIDFLYLSGRIEHVEGNHQTALKIFEEAIQLVKSFSRSYGFPVVYCYLAVVQHELEEEHAALENFRQALEILSRAYRPNWWKRLSGWLFTAQILSNGASRVITSPQ